MQVGVFSSKAYDILYLTQANQAYGFHLDFLESRLTQETAQLLAGYQAICVFVNDVLDEPMLAVLAEQGIRHIALRCAGFNNVDLQTATALGIQVSRVPAYSPEAVAEHTVTLMLSLNRKIHKAYNRVRENNFSLQGLLGFNLHGKTIGLLGLGKIGMAVARIMLGFGCRVIAVDPDPSTSVEGIEKVALNRLLAESDIISLHCPLTEQNQHMIDADAIAAMKTGVMLINTSRGALIDTRAVIAALKSGKIGTLGLDVYEMESELFFQDLSCEIIQDDVFERLAGFPNVIVTGHQGFFTHEALQEIADTTLANLHCFANGQRNARTFLC